VTVPSDRYTWYLLAIDLIRRGCTAEHYAGVPSFVRRMGDGRLLRTPLKGRRDDAVRDTDLDNVLRDLELDPSEFYE